MHQGCLTMQSSTDGRVGGWVLSAHRSSCGSVVPLLFTTKHVGHVRHAPWRHTRAGCCVLIFLFKMPLSRLPPGWKTPSEEIFTVKTVQER